MAAYAQRARRATAWLLAFTSVLVAALAPATPATARSIPPAVAQVSTAPVPGIAQASPAYQLQAVQQSFDLLMDRFVQPLTSADLLQAAWDAVAVEADRQGARPPGPAPHFSRSRAADLAAFQAALQQYLVAAPSLPRGFVPSQAATRGMATSVQEGHTYFMDPKQYQDYLAWARGDVTYAGIGARMKAAPLTVIEVFEGSPASEAGLRPGDVILRVDGASIQGMSLEQTVGLIRGPEGSAVDLLLQRRQEAPFTLRIVRARISLDFVSSRLLEDGVGYVALRGFPESSIVESVDLEVARLAQQGAQSLVLDLRGNSGGRIDVGAALLSRFLPAGSSIYQQVDRLGRQQTRATLGSRPYNLPLVVLIDGGTASMGELFAAALQDHNVATVVGSTSAGNVAAGQVYPLADGSALQVTVMELLSAQGRRLNGVGVVPDQVVDVEQADLTPGEDPVLDRAIQLLRAGQGGSSVVPPGAGPLPIAA